MQEDFVEKACWLAEKLLGRELTEEEVDAIDEEIYIQIDYYESEGYCGPEIEAAIDYSLDECVKVALERAGTYPKDIDLE